MFEQRLSQDFECFGSCPIEEDEMTSGPKRELHEFISTVVDMVGPGATGYLTELWLDELAGLGYLPSPTSPDWRLVSLAASVRLAGRLIEFQLQ